MNIPRLPRTLVGVNTKLGINECWVALFVENERRYKTEGTPRPRTDRELTNFMRQEFNERDSAVWRKVAKVRWRYNNGKLYKGQAVPRVKSYRYSYKGVRVDAKYFDAAEPREGER